MAKKSKVNISRTDDFAEVETELASAMEELDDANARIESLLREQHGPEAEENAATEDATAEAAPDADAPSAEQKS